MRGRFAERRLEREAEERERRDHGRDSGSYNREELQRKFFGEEPAKSPSEQTEEERQQQAEKGRQEEERVLRDYAQTRNIADLIRSEDLERIVQSEGFSTFPNARYLARQYAATLSTYHVIGERRDGKLDQVFVSGRSLVLKYEGDALAALPAAAGDYLRAVVEAVPDNSRVPGQLPRGNRRESNAAPRPKHQVVFRRMGETWKQIQGDALETRRRVIPTSGQVQPALLNVERSQEWTVVQATTDQGMASWIVTKEDVSATRQMRDYLSHSSLIVHDGDDLAKDWLAAILKDSSGHYVRRSRRSPNLALTEAARAAGLADRPLSLADTRVFNSLPQASGASSWIEIWRMGLETARRQDWQKVNRDIVNAARSKGLPIEAASKDSLLRELAGGNSNVIFLIAHNDGETLYLPGALRGSIALDEISRIKRDVAPDRAIVLITCSAGVVNMSRPGLGEILLENRLARTVFASPDPIDAREVPELIAKLVTPGVDLRAVLKDAGLNQSVTVYPVRLPKPGARATASYESTNRHWHAGAAS